MALKVLLADDSAAIKKVVQLSLQDFGVELKSVGSGKDVMDVARSFRPDIAFVDVLLPHKTGYDIASEMKKDAELKNTPIIMLWSSFMAFDEAKFKASGAEDKLEKPFEVAGLRALVTKYVPKTQGNPLGKHLDFPKMEFPPTQSAASRTNVEVPVTAQVEQAPEAGGWNMDSFQEIPAFETELPKMETAPAEPVIHQTSQAPANPADPMWAGDNEWVRKDLSKFQLPIPEEGVEENTVSFQITEAQIKSTDFLLKPNAAPAPTTAATTAAPATLETGASVHIAPQMATPKPALAPQSGTGHFEMTSEITKQIQDQAREVIEKIVWKLVPEIATNVIREELQRLLNEESK